MKSLKKILSILLFVSFVFNLKAQEDFTMGSCPQVDFLITCLFKEVSSPQELIGGMCNLAQGLQFGDCGQRSFAGMVVNRALDLTTQYNVNYIDILVEASKCVLNDSEVAARHVGKPDLCKGQRNPLCLVCNFLKELKRRGITLYTPSADGKNLIMHLSDKGYDQDIIKLLIAHYPDINIHKHENEDPSFFDYSKGQSGLPILSQAIERCAPLEVIEEIIKSGHEVNYRCENCDPPIIQAMKANNKKIGILNVVDVVYSGKLINLLLDYGANPNTVDKNGHKALFISLHQNRNYIFFIDHGANVNNLDVNGCSVLHLIIKNKTPFTVWRINSLIEKYAVNVNVLDFKGNAPLHYVAQKLNTDIHSFDMWYEIAKLLLENGADTEIENEDGEKPRDLIESRERKWLLRDRGRDYAGRFAWLQNGVKRGFYRIGLID